MKPGATPRLRTRRYRLLRASAFILLIAQLGIRTVHHEPTPLADLVIFNAAVACAALSALLAPLFNDRWAIMGISTGVGIWAIGSTLSTAESFYTFHIWRGFSDFAYSLFYPLILLGLIRSISGDRQLGAVQLLDVAIIGIGAISVLASLLLKPAMLTLDGNASAVFLAILYPIGDIVLLVIVLLAMWLEKITVKTALFFLGTFLFTLTDLYFIWKSATSVYPFASLVDDGWVLGLILISEALWHPTAERELNPRILSIGTLTALLASGLLLALAVLHPNNLPSFVLLPALGTLALSFIRMTIALREAREIKDERALARTDELTGLPNRRRFINALDSLNSTDALLLLMDIDGFKKVNDSLGHDAGDELLRQIALRFNRQIPHGSLLARLGGDEFGAIIYGNQKHGIEIAYAIRSSLSYPADLGSHAVTISVSIGAVPNDGKPELMRRADEAMYAAKRSGSGVTLVEL